MRLGLGFGPRPVRPLPAIHPETQAWIDAVVTAGGTVTERSVDAVEAFVRTVIDGGIRDRLARVNLFAGADLAATLVPVFRGPTAGSTLGGATDANTGFVAEDYVETSGLKGSGIGKRLDTGLTGLAADLRTSNYHLAACITEAPVNPPASQRIIGAYSSTLATARIVLTASPTPKISAGCNILVDHSVSWSPGIVVIHNDSGIHHLRWQREERATLDNAASGPRTTHNFAVFCQGLTTGFTEHTNARLGAYVIGRGISTAQAVVLETALARAMSKLSRPTS